MQGDLIENTYEAWTRTLYNNITIRSLHSLSMQREFEVTQSDLFCSACISGDRRTVQSMLQSRPELKVCQGLVRQDHRDFMKASGAEGGWTPLHLAAHYGQIEIVRLLLENGAPVNLKSTNKIGNTPLMAALVGGNIEIMKLMLEAGADPAMTDSTGIDALTLARVSKIAPAIELIESFLAR